MTFNDLVLVILAGIGLLLYTVFVVCLVGYILGKIDQLK